MGLRELKSLNRKKYQRALNKEVRELNKSIKEDWLWNGRFVMRQDCAHCIPFEDKSGVMFEFILEFKDTKTGRVENNMFTNYDASWHMWEWANRCITEIWNVWSEDPNPNEQARLEGRTPPEFF